MSLNMKSLTQALAKTAAVIEKTVQSTVHEVTGPKALQEYELLEQVGSGGLGLVWKLHSGRPRNRSTQTHNQDVCIWLLDKKALAEARQRAGLSKAVEDAFLDIVRADASKLVRLRHPGVVHVIQGLDESKGAMAMVTEPIFASVANVLGRFDNVIKVPKELKGLEMGLLEIKHGLLQLTESLGFLHNNARLVHRSVSPENIFITSSGAWKLAGFGFAVSVDQATNDMPSGPAFHYPEYDADDVLLPLQPSLNYTAPELTRSNSSPVRMSSDIFSLACLAYHLLARRPLIESKNNLKTYMNKVMLLIKENFSNISSELVHDLRCMLSTDELSRPSPLDFTGSPFFRDDTRLRALRFLDHMLERDNMQKADFLKALGGMWTEFDARVLRYKVLPPLCAELRNVVMQPMVLPMVLTIAEAQEKADFESSTFSALIPVLSSATGDSLLLLVKHATLLINKVSQEQLTTHVVPMLVRAYDDPDARMQEEVLRRTISFAQQLDFQVLKHDILPRLHGLALRTTNAAVRVNALLCLGELVQRLDKLAILEILQTLQRCTAVDHSAPTLMCTLGVASAIYKQYGIEYAAEHLLPLLSPLLVAQQLNLQQFAKYMLFVKDVLRKIEEKRGVTLNEVEQGSLDVNMATGIIAKSEVNGMGPLASGTKRTSAWDAEDWASVAKGQKGSATDLAMIGGNPALKVSTAASTATWNTSVAVSSAAPLPAAEIGSFSTFEWPPPTSNSASAPLSNSLFRPKESSVQAFSWVAPSNSLNDELGSRNTVTNGYPTNAGSLTSDDFDPFADWPPRSTNSGSSIGSRPSTSQGILGNQTTILNQPDPFSQSNLNAKEWRNTSTFDNDQPDLGLLFTAPKPPTEPIPLKLAPPPSGLGKGRGRNPVRRSPRPNSSVPSNQPPILDLL